MRDTYGLTRFVGSGTLSRGTDYANRGLAVVLEAPTGEPLDAKAVTGLVRGSAGGRYRTSASYRVNQQGAVTQFEGRCSCPVGDSCKHVVALVLTALDNTQPTLDGTSLASVAPLKPTAQRKPAGPPAWERALNSLLQDKPARYGTHESLGLGFEVVMPAAPQEAMAVPQSWRSTGPPTPPVPPRISIRPMRPGTNGKWIRSGVSWSDIAHGYSSWRFHPEQLRLLAAIAHLHTAESQWGYARSEAFITLSGMNSRAIWGLLAEAAEADLPLFTLDKAARPVIISPERATISVDVARESSGLHLAPTVQLGNATLVAERCIFIGDPAHGVGSWAATAGSPITLAQLDRRADTALISMYAAGGVHVPAADEARFAAHFVPALRERVRLRSTDDTVDLPVEQPPVLAVQVQRAGAHQLVVTMEWIYRVGTVTRRVSTAGAGDSPGRRDAVRESQIIASVVPILAALPHLLHDSAGQLVPAPIARTSDLDTITLVTEVLPQLQAHPEVEVDIVEELLDYREATEAPVIGLRSTPAEGTRDWFDLEVTITQGGRELPFQLIFLALATDQPVLILPDGEYVSLDRPEFHQLRALIEEARSLQDRPGGPLRISRFQAGLWDDLVKIGVVDAQSTAWLSTVNSWRIDPDEPSGEPPAGLTATLRPYQLDGFRWIDLLRRHGLGGILADDMGLGKTVQALATISAAREADPSGGPFLVIAPTSVVGNWGSEIARFTPDLRVVLITETEVRRGVPLADLVAEADVVVTSYTLFRLEFEAYQQLSFDGLILDEAQVVKNHQSKAFQCVKQLSVPVKFAITGTPMENNLMELWALFSIVAPGLFPNPTRFGEQYRVPIERGGDAEALARLRRRIAPLMLRRTKEQVAADLPEKQEQVLELELEPAHRKLYQRQLQRERQKVLGLLGDVERNRFAIFRSLMLLRQASIDPFLVDPANAKVPSTKLNVLMELLTDVISEGHRTLIFSQFTGFLARVRSRLVDEGIDYCYLDGSTRNRPEVLERFRKGSAPVFLISLKAGGVGLNLTEADYCILLDPWWNPATEAQAVDRTHRIGQTKNVMVYRLVAKDTIEEKVMALKDTKAKLFAGVMAGDDGVGIARASKGITAADIRALLA